MPRHCVSRFNVCRNGSPNYAAKTARNDVGRTVDNSFAISDVSHSFEHRHQGDSVDCQQPARSPSDCTQVLTAMSSFHQQRCHVESVFQPLICLAIANSPQSTIHSFQAPLIPLLLEYSIEENEGRKGKLAFIPLSLARSTDGFPEPLN